MKNISKFLAEFIGTYALVFFGAGAIMVNSHTDGAIGHLGICIIFGAIVMAMIYSFGELSGAHINPAVTIAFWVAGRVEGNIVVPYILSQCAGAVAASATLYILFPDCATFGGTVPAGSDMQSFVLEFIMTFFLMLVIMQVSTGSKEVGLLAGIAIATVVLLEAVMGGPISGASMNPARSFGPAIFSGQLEIMWLYVAGPVLGAVASIGVWKVLKR